MLYETTVSDPTSSNLKLVQYDQFPCSGLNVISLGQSADGQEYKLLSFGLIYYMKSSLSLCETSKYSLVLFTTTNWGDRVIIFVIIYLVKSTIDKVVS